MVRNTPRNEGKREACRLGVALVGLGGEQINFMKVRARYTAMRGSKAWKFEKG